MLFKKIGIDKDQLEILISIIDLEFKYKNDDELADLISDNFGFVNTDVKTALQSYKANMGEDYEKESNKQYHYAEY